MGAEKEIIVAVELGSTAIRAIAGKKEPDGTMRVLEITQEDATNSIRKGVIDNIDKTTQTISKVVERLEDKLNVHIKKVYVGLSGQSLHSVKNQVEKQFDTKQKIEHGIIDQLEDTNRAVLYPDSEILDVISQEFRVGGNRIVTDPVGIQCEQIEANFLNIIARKTLSENIEKCIHGAGLEIAELFISPLCLADSLLSTNEKRSGCAIVDFGADTTTVAIYTNNLLRRLTVLPLGGANVTSDIASKNIDKEEAEKLKLNYGTAYHEEIEGTVSKEIPLSFNRIINESELQRIIEARYEEILANVWNCIEEDSDKLLSGIVFCGGAAKINGIAEAFNHHNRCNMPIRLAKGLPINITVSPNVRLAEDALPYSLMSLMLKGDQICISEAPVEHEPVQTELSFNESEETSDNNTNLNEETPAEEGKKKKKGNIRRMWNALNKLFEEE